MSLKNKQFITKPGKSVFIQKHSPLNTKERAIISPSKVKNIHIPIQILIRIELFNWQSYRASIFQSLGILFPEFEEFSLFIFLIWFSSSKRIWKFNEKTSFRDLIQFRPSYCMWVSLWHRFSEQVLCPTEYFPYAFPCFPVQCQFSQTEFEVGIQRNMVEGDRSIMQFTPVRIIFSTIFFLPRTNPEE